MRALLHSIEPMKYQQYSYLTKTWKNDNTISYASADWGNLTSPYPKLKGQQQLIMAKIERISLLKGQILWYVIQS